MQLLPIFSVFPIILRWPFVFDFIFVSFLVVGVEDAIFFFVSVVVTFTRDDCIYCQMGTVVRPYLYCKILVTKKVKFHVGQ